MTKQEARVLLADAGLSPEGMEKADALLAGAPDELSTEIAAAIADIVEAEHAKDMTEMQSLEQGLDADTAELSAMDSFVQKTTFELEEIGKALEA